MNEKSAAAVANAPIDPSDRLGMAFALGAAAALGLAIALSRYAYEGGTNGFTLASIRGCFASLVMLAVCLATGRSIRVSVRDWLHLTGLGVLISVVFYGNVGAVEYIAVGLTALLVYTYPPIIAAIEAGLTRTVPPALKVMALLVAFAGLFLMLGVSFGPSDPRGILLALAASLAAATNSVWFARRARHIDIMVATLHMTVAAMVTVLAAAVLNGEFVLPATAAGWGGLCAVVVLQSTAGPIYFAGISRIGPLKSAMLSNIQPVTSIVAALILFDEWLSPVQFAGGAMVIAGIVLMQWRDARDAGAAGAMRPTRRARPR